uniref:Uncharacterized protein n=1 Tax=Nelumbo nucifera TaxID=4432 RepID=A0A822XWW9_NELNU|nr:TPA_asm: hypothetical protein HUJ06_025123 [Nelumbo nucifera]
MKSLNAWSVGQNTVNPPTMLSSNVCSAPEATSVSAKTLQPCFDIRDVRFNWLGPGVGASASADAMILLIWMTEILYGISSTDLTKVASRLPWLDSAPKPTLPPLRSVMLTKPEEPGAEPVAWNMVAVKAVPFVI